MNKKIAWSLTAAALLLAGCEATRRFDPLPGGDSDLRSAVPVVKVEARNGTVSIDVEPLALFFSKRGEKEIVWTLDPRSGFTFAPENGIRIEGEFKETVATLPRGGDIRRQLPTPNANIDPRQDQIVNCRPRNNNLQYVCTNRHTRAGIFKYSVRLTNQRQDFLLDPMIVNW